MSVFYFTREEMLMKICKHCEYDIDIKKGYYQSAHNSICNNCGDKILIFNGSLNASIYSDFYQEYYSDEELKRLEIFEWIQEEDDEESHLLDESDMCKFFKSEEYDGELFEVYLDDYGQSFHLAWRDPLNDQVKTWCCGTYNDYHWDMEGIAAHIKKQREKGETIGE